VKPVLVVVFDQWAESNRDTRVRAQLYHTTLIFTMPSHFHDAAALYIGEHIAEAVRAMRPARDARVHFHGGWTSPEEFLSPSNRLVNQLNRNNGRKDADMAVFSSVGGIDTQFPGIAIEVGYSNCLSKTCRDTTLWIDSSDCHV
jgi:hypothetical protein